MPGPLAIEVANLIKRAQSEFEIIRDNYYEDPTNVESPPAANAENLPPAFHDVGKHVPVVCDILEVVREHTRERNDDSTCAEMKCYAEECKGKADCLEKLFSKVIGSAADKKIECYRAFVRGMDDESRVEDLMMDAMESIKLLLTIDEQMQEATKPQLELLIKSMKEVSAIPQSLQDESENTATRIHNHGAGPQNVHTGRGAQNNNNGTGMQMNGGAYHNYRQ